MDINKFESIRPYYDDEIPAAMKRIASSQYFPQLASYVYPDKEIEDVRNYIRNISTIREFQLEVMYNVNLQIIKRGISSLTFDGIENIEVDKKYLFVSNHRDIMLDSCLLQYILHISGHETTEITFGANLMTLPVIIDIGKSNKMFRVERGGSMKEFYQSSMLLSEYLRYTLTQKKESVWIAQRNGRTKDGIDKTEPGLISMFASSLSSDKIKALEELNIVPVSISYEYETCDLAKAYELYVSRTEKYKKQPGEDLKSILSGIMDQKGSVHIAICKPITNSELNARNCSSKQEFFKAVANLIDERINSAYKLYSNNYIAYDLLKGCEDHHLYYSDAQKAKFIKRLNGLDSFNVREPEVLRNIFLGIYANPVIFHPNVPVKDND